MTLNGEHRIDKSLIWKLVTRYFYERLDIKRFFLTCSNTKAVFGSRATQCRLKFLIAALAPFAPCDVSGVRDASDESALETER